MTRTIESGADLAEGLAWLAQVEPRLGAAAALTGPLPLRRRPAGFGALMDIVCSQQLSVASADAVLGRLAAAGALTPAGLGLLDDAALRACGLSRQKIRYARALAAADLDYDALAQIDEDAAVAALTAITGIGRWSAEIYLMFSVGRADVLAAGDLALQEGARMLFELPSRPSERDLRAMAQAWSPWRAVAARLLWAYYLHQKSRPGLSE